MSIKDAIGQLPSWPGFAVGAVVFFSIGGWYYGTTYSKCTELRDQREWLKGAIEKAAADGIGVVNFAEVVTGDWDEVRVVQGHRPGKTPLNCPFGWDMTWRERQTLIEAGKYTVIGFFQNNKFSHYIEYRADEGSFSELPKSIARSNARFQVTKPVDQSEPYTLKLIQ